MTEMYPCVNPAICGVMRHRFGTQCRARLKSSVRAKQDREMQANISRPPQASESMSTDKRRPDNVDEIKQIDRGYGATSSLLLTGGDHPYSDMEDPVIAGLELDDGTKIEAWDRGSIETFQLADGSTYRSHVHPRYYPESMDRDEDASELMTREQFQMLERADENAALHFDEKGEHREKSRSEVIHMVMTSTKFAGRR